MWLLKKTINFPKIMTFKKYVVVANLIMIWKFAKPIDVV